MNQRTVFVVPVEGRIVPDPERGDDIPAGGRVVPRTTYWLRAINAGDLEAREQPKVAGKQKGEAQ